jgi:hypothetical protein
VINRATGDPTTVPVLLTAAATDLIVPSLAHAPGSGGTQWRTDVAAVNRDTVPATVSLSYTSYDGTRTLGRTASIDALATTEWPDIVVTLFGLSADESNKGTLRVSSPSPLALTSRTFNQAASGTFGQYYPALAGSDALTPGQVGILPQIKKNSSFRTNLGVVNLGDTEVAVLVKLFGTSGARVGGSRTITVPAGRWLQQDDIFGSLGAGSQDIAYATVEVQTVGGRAWAYASVIDNATGDPTTIPVLVQ